MLLNHYRLALGKVPPMQHSPNTAQPYLIRIEQKIVMQKVFSFKGGGFFWSFDFIGGTPCALALQSAKYLSSWVFIHHSKTSDVSSPSGNMLGWLLDR